MSRYRTEHFVDRTSILEGFASVLAGLQGQVVLAIEAPANMGKSFLALQLREMCLQASSTPHVALVDFRNAREQRTIQQRRLLSAHLRAQLGHDVGDVFDPFDNALGRAAVSARSDAQAAAIGSLGVGDSLASVKNRLAHRLVKYCRKVVLHDVLVEIDLVLDHFEGSSLPLRVFRIVDHVHKEGRIEQLLGAVESVHPNASIDWRDGMEPLLLNSMGPTNGPRTAVSAADAAERAAVEHMLNEAFFEGLKQLADGTGPLVIILDALELVDEVIEEAGRWVKEELIERISSGELKNVHLVLLGRDLPDMQAFGMGRMLRVLQLRPFSEDDIRTYFEDCRQIDLKELGLDIATIMITSGGLPGELAGDADRVIVKRFANDPWLTGDSHG